MGHKGSHWIECFKVSHRESIISSCSHPTSKTSVSLAHTQRKALHESSKIFVEHVPLGAWIQFRTRLNSGSLDTAGLSVMTFGPSAINTDARTLNTSLTRENKID